MVFIRGNMAAQSPSLQPGNPKLKQIDSSVNLLSLFLQGPCTLNQRFSKSAGLSQPANFQLQSLDRLLKTITQ